MNLNMHWNKNKNQLIVILKELIFLKLKYFNKENKLKQLIKHLEWQKFFIKKYLQLYCYLENLLPNIKILSKNRIK